MSGRSGLTLIELLVVIAIIAVLTAISIPAVQSARESGRRVQCQSKIRQVGIALQNYHSAHRHFPSGYVSDTRARGTDWCTSGRTNNRAPWSVGVLPFMEEPGLYSSFRFDEDFTPDENNPGSLENHLGWLTPMPKFRCPSALAISDNLTNYIGVQGGGEKPDCEGGSPTRVFYRNGVLFHNSRIRVTDVMDGASQVMLLGETKYQARRMGWASTAKLDFLAVPMTIAAATDTRINAVKRPSPDFEIISRMFGSYHIGGCHFVMVDGSTQFLTDSIDLEIYQQLADRADGQPSESFLQH